MLLVIFFPGCMFFIHKNWVNQENTALWPLMELMISIYFLKCIIISWFTQIYWLNDKHLTWRENSLTFNFDANCTQWIGLLFFFTNTLRFINRTRAWFTPKVQFLCAVWSLRSIPGHGLVYHSWNCLEEVVWGGVQLGSGKVCLGVIANRAWAQNSHTSLSTHWAQCEHRPAKEWGGGTILLGHTTRQPCLVCVHL